MLGLASPSSMSTSIELPSLAFSLSVAVVTVLLVLTKALFNSVLRVVMCASSQSLSLLV